MQRITLTALRARLYRIVDDVIARGEPVEIERNGHRVRIVPVDDRPNRLERLTRRDVITGDPEDLVTPTASEWNEAKNVD